MNSLVIEDADTGELTSYADQEGYEPVHKGITRLAEAAEIIGHNIISFDIPALQKVYPWFKVNGLVLDTLILARLFWPEIMYTDEPLLKRGKLPRRLRGSHGLEAYGYRLGVWKGDYAAERKAELIAHHEEQGLPKPTREEIAEYTWNTWSVAMQDYCEQDVITNSALLKYAMKVWRGEDRKGFNTPYSDRSVRMEMRVAQITQRQHEWGFTFNREKAEALYVELIREREEILTELKATIKPWYVSEGETKVTRTRRAQRKDLPPIGEKIKRDGTVEPVYVRELFEEGTTHTKIRLTEFNPNSGHHIADRLKFLHNWQPQEFTPSGEPKTDETTLAALPWPEARQLTRYMTIAKRIGQVAEGNNAWLKKERNGRIHGRINTVGAVTRRMTHMDPNLAQVPSVRKGKDGQPLLMWEGGYGAECRDCFEATKGYVLVGCDADALELRCLAGYMARYDGGEYIDTVLRGDKDKGTDMHSVNCRALGMDPKALYDIGGREEVGREIAKTWFYAFIYGAGDHKLGTVLGARGSSRQIMAVGKKSREDFLKNLPALGTLTKKVQERAFGNRRKGIPARGFIVGLDGGKIRTRHKHAALNTLLQSAGAIIMKVALVILDDDLQALGLVPGQDYEFAANVHDEWQIDVLPEHVETVMKVSEDAIKKAGEELDFRCPLAGNADSGESWKYTH